MKTIGSTLWDRIRLSSLVRNTGWMLVAQVGRLLIQGAYFVLIARALGSVGLGAFTGALAFVSILVPFAGWGSGNVLIKNVARDSSSFSVYWGNALVIILVSGSILCTIALVLSCWLMPTLPFNLIATLGVAEFIFGRLVDTAAQAFQAFERLAVTAQINLVIGAARLTAALLFVLLSDNSSVEAWGKWYLMGTVVTAVVSVLLVNRKLGKPAPKLKSVTGGLLEGFYFALGLASATIYNDIDKAMLSRVSTLDATGIYAAAYRVINLMFSPIRSLLSAAYARFFKSGSSGIQGSLLFARRLLPLSAAYGLTCAFALLLFAPLMPYVLGAEYRAAVDAVRLLAVIPFFQSLHYFAADTLTGAGYQGLRSVIQVGVAILNVLLNLWLLPRYSWQGAAWVSIASDGSLVLLLWGTVAWLHRVSRIKASSVTEHSA